MISQQWLDDQQAAVKPHTQERNRRMLANDLIPYIGSYPMRSIKPSDVLAAAKTPSCCWYKRNAWRCM